MPSSPLARIRLSVTLALVALTSLAANAQTAEPSSRLINLSVRGRAGSEAQMLTAGFTVTGSPDKPILLRAIGPTLGAFGVTNFVVDPSLQLLADGAVLRANNDWTIDIANGRSLIPEHQNAFTVSGAFPLNTTSKDAAFIRSMAPRGYSAQVVASTGPGLALIELYDLFPTSGARLSNLSARAQVGPGADALIAGFIIAGSGPKRVLLRAVGPGLTQLGVSGVLANPKLDLYRGSTVIERNDDWGGTAELRAAFSAAGAFNFSSADSRDAALVVTLMPGVYTAMVTGTGNETGIALVEIYELP